MTDEDSSPASIRIAVPGDLAAVLRFGAAVIPAHYGPLIGTDAARRQLDVWWSAERMGPAIEAGLVLVAEVAGRLVGLAERGTMGADQVVWKLYVAADRRGAALGPALLAAVGAALPQGTDRLWIEHVAADERAAAFYQREGFRVDRVEPDRSGDPRLATVWRVRTLVP